jgi:hypothetical protein
MEQVWMSTLLSTRTSLPYSSSNVRRLIGPRTGYQSGTVAWSSIFGRDVIERAGPVWGLDDEGELRGVYRPSGHPAVRTYGLRRAGRAMLTIHVQLWYGGGDFQATRWGSKQLVRLALMGIRSLVG